MTRTEYRDAIGHAAAVVLAAVAVGWEFNEEHGLIRHSATLLAGLLTTPAGFNDEHLRNMIATSQRSLRYFTKDGRKSSEVEALRRLLRAIGELAGETLAARVPAEKRGN